MLGLGKALGLGISKQGSAIVDPLADVPDILFRLQNRKLGFQQSGYEPQPQSRFISDQSGGAKGNVYFTYEGVDILVIVPDSYDPATPTGLVFYHMGNGEDRNAWNTETLKFPVRDALLADGYLLAGISAGPTSWGNDAALSKYVIAHNWIIQAFNVSGVVLMVQSMGGTTGFRAAHDPFAFPMVRGVYAIYPVCSVLSVLDDTDTFDEQILGAWGVADRTGLASALVNKDPISLSYPNIRYRFHHSDGDTVVLKANNTDKLRAVLGEKRENSLIVTTGNHGDSSNFDPSDIIEFVSRSLRQDTAYKTYPNKLRLRGAGIKAVNLDYLEVPATGLYGDNDQAGSKFYESGPYVVWQFEQNQLWYITERDSIHHQYVSTNTPVSVFDAVFVTIDSGVSPAPTVSRVPIYKGDIMYSLEGVDYYRPLGQYKDEAATVPCLTEADLTAAWRDEYTSGKPKATQGDSSKQPMTQFIDGVPGIDFSVGSNEGFTTGVYVGGEQWAISVLEIPKSGEDPNTRTVQSADRNALISPSRPSNAYFLGVDVALPTNSPAGVPVLTTMARDENGIIKVWSDGEDISLGVAVGDFGPLCIGSEGQNNEPANTRLLAVVVYTLPYREQIEELLNALKP